MNYKISRTKSSTVWNLVEHVTKALLQRQGQKITICKHKKWVNVGILGEFRSF